ncbi:MAG: tRNA pseudouridine(38-40) synthase TruA [Gammaproteobacteria bacterium]|nr:tRNA pseudouridine(38-40) synthase TruA [Gammaproteobacteria bacterium]MDH3447349.1 tRNA pseudouridine(38-40) synthase TruA [Gammaproteobacteria bacterium]
MRYALGIEYGGAAYCGWQRQPHCESIQQNLESALGFVANHPVDLVCAGRTDAGVHAIEQVAHFDSDAERSERAWVLGANCRLPRDIRLLWVAPVAKDFHARFSATARSYRYIIMNTDVPSAVFHDRVSWEFRPLDHEAMHESAQILLGEHDFSSFRAVGCQAKSSSRYVHEISVSRRGRLIFLDVRANAFLYHMVRNIAGSLIAVGRGDHDGNWFREVFEARDRNRAEVTASAAGLYFLKPSYREYKLPTRARKPVLF